jgi:N-acetylglucosamine malate deacetylase 1
MAVVMVFAPHPDDDVIGCGGSIANHVKNGDEVSIVFMTSGEAGSLRYSPEELALVREAEAQSAAAVLGVKEVTFLGNPDGFLEYNQENLEWITTALRSTRPDLVYTPHSQDNVPDHQATYRLVVESCRRAAGPWFGKCGTDPWQVKTILGYEVWTPLEIVAHQQDITDYIGTKLEALRIHKTQLEQIPYDEAVKGLNRYRGIMTGNCDYCECFEIIKVELK